MSSSPFPSCFRPSPNAESHPPPPPPPHSTISNLTIYHTDTGPVSLTWSRSIVGRSLHIQLHQNPLDSPPYPNPNPNPSPSTTLSFHLHIRPFLFWKKHGSKKLAPNTHLFWNLSRAKFGATPEPLSGFYVALVVHNHMTLLIGDAARDAFSKSKARHPNTPQLLLLKKERVFADRLYTTRARFGGKAREIRSIAATTTTPSSASAWTGRRCCRLSAEVEVQRERAGSGGRRARANLVGPL
eukprot:XP_025983961.1 uncharacterized protein LOC100775282 [Glycine max]